MTFEFVHFDLANVSLNQSLEHSSRQGGIHPDGHEDSGGWLRGESQETTCTTGSSPSFGPT